MSQGTTVGDTRHHLDAAATRFAHHLESGDPAATAELRRIARHMGKRLDTPGVRPAAGVASLVLLLVGLVTGVASFVATRIGMIAVYRSALDSAAPTSEDIAGFGALFTGTVLVPTVFLLTAFVLLNALGRRWYTVVIGIAALIVHFLQFAWWGIIGFSAPGFAENSPILYILAFAAAGLLNFILAMRNTGKRQQK